jgi:hypothetical protein
VHRTLQGDGRAGGEHGDDGHVGGAIVAHQNDIGIGEAAAVARHLEPGRGDAHGLRLPTGIRSRIPTLPRLQAVRPALSS